MSSLTAIEPKITILDQDVNMVDGLYSLNDLHKLSGGENKHRPTFFLQTEPTKDLIAEIELQDYDVDQPTSKNIAIKTVRGRGKKQGTYVCKELVYSYAMWVSAKFALIVIRTFDEVTNNITQGYKLGDLQNLRDAASARYALGFSVASGGGKVLSQWRTEKNALDAEIAVLDNLMQPLLTGFNEAKAVEVVK